MKKDLYGLSGSFQTKAGKATELSAILLEAAQLMKSAPGCHLYVVGISRESPDEVFITEIWKSKSDHDNSLNLPGVRELISRALPLLDGPPKKGQELTILGGHL